MQIRDRVFLVTGAGSGLGAATVRALGAAGARVLAVDVQAAAAEATAAACGSDAMAVAADVTDAGAVQAAITAARERFGALHGAVNCAGVAVAAKTVSRGEPHDLDVFRKVVEVNLVGTFNVLRLAAAAMLANEPNADGERGVIINTASIAAFEGQIGQVAYAASKAGVVGLTLPAARDLARDGIRVMTIAPGLFDTAMLASLPASVRQSLAATIPFPPRLGDPAEYARLVLAICENPMLNGETIRLDGALRMAPK